MHARKNGGSANAQARGEAEDALLGRARLKRGLCVMQLASANGARLAHRIVTLAAPSDDALNVVLTPGGQAGGDGFAYLADAISKVGLP